MSEPRRPSIARRLVAAVAAIPLIVATVLLGRLIAVTTPIGDDHTRPWIHQGQMNEPVVEHDDHLDWRVVARMIGLGPEDLHRILFTQILVINDDFVKMLRLAELQKCVTDPLAPVTPTVAAQVILILCLEMARDEGLKALTECLETAVERVRG